MYKSFGVFHVGVEDAETSSFFSATTCEIRVFVGRVQLQGWIELICLMQFGFEARISHIKIPMDYVLI